MISKNYKVTVDNLGLMIVGGAGIIIVVALSYFVWFHEKRVSDPAHL
jgi:hypothetical protein